MSSVRDKTKGNTILREVSISSRLSMSRMWRKIRRTLSGKCQTLSWCTPWTFVGRWWFSHKKPLRSSFTRNLSYKCQTLSWCTPWTSHAHCTITPISNSWYPMNQLCLSCMIIDYVWWSKPWATLPPILLGGDGFGINTKSHIVQWFCDWFSHKSRSDPVSHKTSV